MIEYSKIRYLNPLSRSERLNSVFGMFDGLRHRGFLDLQPDYQRKHVWSLSQSEAYVGHVLAGGGAGLFVLNRSYEDDVHEVVDGQQRLTALFKFFDGEIDAVLDDGRRVNIRDASEGERKMMLYSIALQTTIVRLSRPERIRLYIDINKGGTVHSPEEIEHARQLLEEAQ